MINNLSLDLILVDETLESMISDGLRETVDVDRRGRLHCRDTYCSRRNAILALKQGTTELDDLFPFYTEIGNTVENIILKGIRKKGGLLFKDYVVKTPLNIGGRVDAIVLVNGKIRVLEIKTVGELPDKPKGSYLSQVQTYAAICGMPYTILYLSRKIHKFEFNKMKPDFKTFNYNFDLEILKPHFFEVSLSHFYLQNGLLPEKIFRHKYQCEYCEFKTFCWENGKNPSVLKEPTVDEKIKMLELATEFNEEYMSRDSVIIRRNGILKHIENSSIAAKRKLENIDWDKATT